MKHCLWQRHPNNRFLPEGVSMAHPEQAPALAVEELEARSLPSVQFLPVGLAEGGAEPPVVKEGSFHPPAFGPGKPASDNCRKQIRQRLNFLRNPRGRPHRLQRL